MLDCYPLQRTYHARSAIAEEPPHATGSTFEREIKARSAQDGTAQGRANNPDNYEPDFKGKKGRKTVSKKGKAKKGKRKWNNSKTYNKSAASKRKLERKKSAYAKSQNRRIVNEILRHGKEVKTENVSVKGWQKRYGKAISAKSPGFVQSELKRKAESAGGSNTCVFYPENCANPPYPPTDRRGADVAEPFYLKLI